MPTGTGKTLVGLLFAEELAKRGLRILVLEPTRILVEQVYRFYKEYSDLDVDYYHGLKGEKTFDRQVIITTPESAIANHLKDFDAVIVDECHHAVGEDPLKKFLEQCKAQYRLGLTAHVPLRHRKSLEYLIGKVLEWDYSHPSIKPYVPEWIAEVYESPFNEKEMGIYKEIEGRLLLSDRKDKLILRIGLVFFSRDGALALKDSLSRKTRLSQLLKDLKEEVKKLRDLHKLPVLLQVLDQHDFNKAIVFIDRVIVARRVAEVLKAALISGKRSPVEKKRELEEARKASIVVSTSAGEEGVDLPTADLLVVWSNTSSVLRFVQRRGRVMRKAGKIPKSVVFIVTPDTVDVDLFVEGIYAAKQVGIDVGVLEELVKDYATKGTRGLLLDFLAEPMPVDWLSEVVGMPRATVKRNLNILCREGLVVPVYTEAGRAYIRADYLPYLAEKRPELFNPSSSAKLKVKTEEKRKKPPFFLKKVVVKEVKDGVEYVYSLPVNCLVRREVWDLLKQHYLTPSVYRTWG